MAESSSNEIHGFDHEFDPDVDRKYQCPICLAVLRDAVQTTCGHRFCDKCLKGVIRDRSCAKCPVDNTWFRARGEVFADNATRREVLSLTVRCDHRLGDKKCTWKGELRFLQEHVGTCQIAPIACEYNCGLTVTRGEMSVHLSICRRRPVRCDHCHQTLPWAERPKHHLLECEKFPVTCTLCGAIGIIRSSIPDHIDQDCPLVEVRCNYYRVGCKAEEKRQNLDKHHKEHWQQHLALMMDHELVLEARMDRYRADMESLTSDLADLKNIVVWQEQILERQQRMIEIIGGDAAMGRLDMSMGRPIGGAGEGGRGDGLRGRDSAAGGREGNAAGARVTRGSDVMARGGVQDAATSTIEGQDSEV